MSEGEKSGKVIEYSFPMSAYVKGALSPEEKATGRKEDEALREPVAIARAREGIAAAAPVMRLVLSRLQKSPELSDKQKLFATTLIDALLAEARG